MWTPASMRYIFYASLLAGGSWVAISGVAHIHVALLIASAGPAGSRAYKKRCETRQLTSCERRETSSRIHHRGQFQE